MNFTETAALENQIKKLSYDEIKDRINQADNQNDRNFWFAIYDRALQLRQKDIINAKEFIR
ncbi:hypothetical protein PT287_09800 [Lactobacillus sp. ESL0679]|uniref:hypothetical protein n=1 Tax=Lactobacillus sp. ESL0679 TaxID=2983209 RepID=UPI0023F91711|nr:hypothetical protein [Lactobacillus sp. ESL0679]MDF7683791.1 hypothetical protein [Lactobacillus sp. ESL0679]